MIEEALAQAIKSDHAPYTAEPYGGEGLGLPYALLRIFHPDHPGYWVAGAPEVVWGADYYDNDDGLADPVVSVATRCYVSGSTSPEVVAEITHALIGAIDIYHRHGKVTAYPMWVS